MRKFIESKIGIIIFISASLSALLFYVVLSSGRVSTDNHGQDKYFLNENYDNGDELITKVPNLSDMLAGPIISWDDPNQGDKYAKVILVEYADFKCDYCRAQEQNLKRILDKYRGLVRLIWKDYPETDESSESFQAALAGRCANEQGLFWEYHDFLFEYNDDLSRENLIHLANLAGLNERDFMDCIDNDQEHADQIRSNMTEADALGITGIPFVYVNNQELFGNSSYEDLELLVEIELSR